VVQPNGSSWVKLAQVGQVEQVEAGLQIYVGQVGQEQRGLQIYMEQVGQEQGVCPAEPLHLTQMELSGRGTFCDSRIFFMMPNPAHLTSGITLQVWIIGRPRKNCF